jgi:hypothetical protein
VKTYIAIIIFMVSSFYSKAQTINLYANDGFGYNLVTSQIDSVLSEEDFILKVVISETAEYTFTTGDHQLTLEITNANFPVSAAPSYTNTSGTSDITGFGTAVISNGNQIINTITIGGEDTSDEFSISEIPVHIPENISGPTDYQLILHHNLSGTDESVTLITFRYIKPELVITPDAGVTCPTHEVATTLSILPNDLTFELHVGGSYQQDVADGAQITFPKDADVYIKDPNNTNDYGQSATTKIAGEQFFEDITLTLLTTETNLCARQPLEFDLNLGTCNTNPDKLDVLFKPVDSTDYDTIPVLNFDIANSPAFEFVPTAIGEIRVLATYGTGNDTALMVSNAENTPNILLYDEYNFQGNIRVSQMAGEFEMLKKLTTPYEYDSIVTVNPDGILGREWIVYGNLNTTHTLGRLDYPYRDESYTPFDVYFDPENSEVTTGSLKNEVIFKYGKYFSEVEEYCWDYDTAIVTVIEEDIFVPAESFCAYDDSAYQIIINQDVGAFEVDSLHLYTAKFHRYDIIVGETVVATGTDSIFSFIPSQFYTVENITTVKIQAVVELVTKEKPDSCPPAWTVVELPIYQVGNRVSHFGKEYRCISPAYASDVPGQNDQIWQFIRNCPTHIIQRSENDTTLNGREPLPIGGYDCIYDEWTINGNPMPQYRYGDKVTHNESIYKAEGDAYEEDEPGESDRWSYVGECGMGEDSTIVYTNYASKSVYIRAAKTDGRFLNLNDRYCITNQPIELLSNYNIDSVWQTDGIGLNSEENWAFVPEQFIQPENTLDTVYLNLAYTDNFGCMDTIIESTIIDKHYNVNTEVDLSLEDEYCPANVDFELDSRFAILGITGPGVSQNGSEWVFNPALALGDSTYLDTSLTLFYRENKGCKYDAPFPVTIDAFDYTDQTGSIAALNRPYCGVENSYLLEMDDPDKFIIDTLIGFGVYHISEQNKYYYNPELVVPHLDSLPDFDTVVLSYLDENLCPYTKSFNVSIDPGFVDNTSNLIIDSTFCGANNNYPIGNSNNLHTLVDVEGKGIINDGSSFSYVPFQVFDNESAVYENNIIFDTIRAYFKDPDLCPYENETVVKISGMYGDTTNAELFDFATEYCRYDDSVRLRGNYQIDSILGQGVRAFSDSTIWFFDPADTSFVSEPVDIQSNLTYYYQDSAGCPWYKPYDITLFAMPQPDFVLDSTTLCFGDATLFRDTTKFGVLEQLRYSWNFGNGKLLEATEFGDYNVPANMHSGQTSGSYRFPTHIYDDPGYYTVQFGVESEHGCTNNLTKEIVIGNYPQVAFDFNTLTVGFGTHFQNLTTSEVFDPVSTSVWDWDELGNHTITQGVLDTTYVYQTMGVHKVHLTSTTEKGCSSSDSLLVPIFAYKALDSLNIYNQSFNGSLNDWIIAADYDSTLISGWQLESIEEPLIMYPNLTGKIWHTGHADSNLFNENGWIESPTFDISELNFPLLSVDIYQSVESGRDGAVVQYTIDDGEIWEVVSSGNSTIDAGMNWYNQTGIVSSPGNQSYLSSVGWSSYQPEWITARFPIDYIRNEAIDAGSRGVRFRVAYASDQGNAPGLTFNGFAIDNFLITSRARIVLLEQFVNMQESRELQESEEANMDTITNFGLAQEVVDIRYHNFIGNDYDTLYYLNTPDISARSMEYGAYLQQLTMVDGIHRCLAPAKDSIEAYYKHRTLKDKAFDMDIELYRENDSLIIDAYITKLKDTLTHESGTQRCIVRMAVVQKEYTLDEVTYADGTIEHDKTFKNVLVELLPMGIGNVVETIPHDWPVLEPKRARGAWLPDNVTTVGQEYRVVVYVQGIWGMDEVHQVWFKDLTPDLIPQHTMENNTQQSNEDDTDMLESQKLKIYPTPATHKLMVNWGEPMDKIHWEIRNIVGEKMLEGETENGDVSEEILIQQLSSGVYILMMESQSSNYYVKRKIVIDK